MFKRVALIACISTPLWAQNATFGTSLYPVMEKAACRSCHTSNGVASGTRLHLPEPDATPEKVEAFGKSLVVLVDRTAPGSSLLLNKPTARIPHAGGERIKPGSTEEATLKAWIDRLTSLSGEDLTRALSYREQEARGGGKTVQQAELRRLTHSQYNHTVRDLLGDQTAPANQFPPEDFINGFRNQSGGQSLSPLLIEAYSAAAERLARSAFQGGDTHGLIPCKPSAGCRARFVREFGLKAFRRPLNAGEQKRYETLLASEGDFLKGAQLVVEAMLQSSNFLFRVEATSDPKLRPYATANRLSYSLWDTMPNPDLFAAAERGELSTGQGVEKAARQMLDKPLAREALTEFVSQWLRFDRVLTASKDRRKFPLFTRETALAMTEEARTFVSDLVWNDGNFMTLFTANYGYVSPELATIYKVAAPAKDFDKVPFPADSERAGLLGQGLFLALTAKPDDSSPTARGLFVREQFLCQHVPDPPPGVNTTLPPVTEAKPQTNRDRMTEHATNPTCATCHKLIDPIGFGLEKFDAVGGRRDRLALEFRGRGAAAEGSGGGRGAVRKVEIDFNTEGNVAGIPDSRFSSPAELGAVLAKSAQCQECVVKQYFRYSAGRMDTIADAPLIRRVSEQFRDSQFRFKELIVALTRQENFLTPKEQPMSQVITKRVRTSRRSLLKGLTAAGAQIAVGLPPLISMFNSTGTAYAAPAAGVAGKPIETRFVLWFNGNGIPERYWIPSAEGVDYLMTPCLSPLAAYRKDVHVLSGVDNAAANGKGNGHTNSMSGLMTGTDFTGRGPSGPSIDQIIASKIGNDSRFRSLQIGVAQESFGESMQRNMSWAGYERALPPEMIPHRFFDRLFGAREEGWVNRKRSILDAVRDDATALKKNLPADDQARVEEHLAGIRDLERAIAGLPPEYRNVNPPDFEGDMKDWPRIAKLQSDLLVQAFATHQTRVASYMLTKCQSLARFPWLGYTSSRHHDYTHAEGKTSGADGVDGQHVMRDICKWHVEEFAYLISRLESVPEGDGNLFDHTSLIFAHEHAEANPHKNSGLAMIVAGGSSKLAKGAHTRVTGTVGDVYVTVADEVVGASIGKFPTATKKLGALLS